MSKKRKSYSTNRRQGDGVNRTSVATTRKRRRRRRNEGDRENDYRRTIQERPSTTAPQKSKKRVLSVLLNFLFYFVTISLVVGALLFAVSRDSEKSFFGYRFYTVLTNSMRAKDPHTQKGGFSAGDVIIVQMINPKELKVGDIVTFSLMAADPESKAVLTHRVKEVKKVEKKELNDKDELVFITQGDANDAEDNPVTADRIIGKKVWLLPKVGLVMDYLKENFLVSLGALIAVFALIISLRYYFSFSGDEDPLERGSVRARH